MPPPLQLRRRRGLGWVGWLLALLLVGGVVAWVSTHPEELPTTQQRVVATTPVGDPVYVGVFAARPGFDRTLHLAGVRIFASSTVDVEITPQLCKGGSVGVTTSPEAFCDEVVGTEGTTMVEGDEIVLEIAGDDAGTVAIDRIRVAYRDGVQWGTDDAGAPSVVSLIPR